MSADPRGELAPLILFVEDEVLIREMVVEALQDAGFSCEAVSDGEAAMAFLDEAQDQPRGLITDINLGHGIDGWELGSAARERVADLPVVYVSGASGHEWTSRGVPNSVLVTKPFAPAQLVVAISSLMVASDTAS